MIKDALHRGDSARYFNTSIDELLGYEINLSKEDLESFLNKCKELMKAGRFEEVVTECETMLYQYPNNFDLRLGIGSLYMMGISYQKDEESMVALSKKSIKLLEEASQSSDSKTVEQAHFILASLYGMNGEEDKAEEVLLQLPKIELNPDDLLIPTYVRQEKYEEAKKLLQGNLFKCIQSISLYLANFQNIAMKEGNKELAERLLLMNEAMIEVFEVASVFGLGHQLGAMNFYASFKNEEKTLDYLTQLVNALTTYQPNSKKLELFEFVSYHENHSLTHLVQLVLQSLAVDPSYEFIKENEQFKQIIGELEALL